MEPDSPNSYHYYCLTPNLHLTCRIRSAIFRRSIVKPPFLNLKSKLMIPLLFLVLSAQVAGAAQQKNLAAGHVPGVVAQGRVTALGRVAATNRLQLTIGLPLRNRAELNRFLRNLYDPARPEYRHYLSPAEFTARFGPSADDYARVTAFANTNHLRVTRTSANRMLLAVNGAVAEVERAFHVRLNTYRHPREPRHFFAPDAEPTVESGLPIQDVSGLSDYARPHPCLHFQKQAGATPQAGSAPGGGYLGGDFRQAYVPGTPLTGNAQTVGLFQLDGYDPNDIAAYASLAGMTNVPLQNVLLDGFDGTPGGYNDEVCLDIEMAMSMAPGLAKIIVYEGYIPNDILNQMALDDAASQLSCSWTWNGGPTATTDQIFIQMAAQGQSFFTASGDSGAYAAGAIDDPGAGFTPVDNPLVTSVGGTTLQTDDSGNRLAETTWNWGGGYGSSGGSSSYYEIPYWQGGIDLTRNGGSPTTRNIPDVALTADNVYIAYGSGSFAYVGGTSCAAPLWAAFTALVNEQGAQLGQPAAGFLNPTLYNLSRGTNYPAVFNDITTGNNTNAGSPDAFFAVTGYDLCTGWGTPNGTNLINALTTPVFLGAGGTNVNFTGTVGRPIAATNWVFNLTNSGPDSLSWVAGQLPAWGNVSPAAGTLPPNGSVSLNVTLPKIDLLPPGAYQAALAITNLALGQVPIAANLLLTINPTVSPLRTTGYLGGTFSPASWPLNLTNDTGTDMNWAAGTLPPWFTISPAAGTVPAHGSVTLNLSLTTPVSVPPDNYQTLILITNLTQHSLQFAAYVTLAVNPSLVQNGGFETGDFTAWNLVGDTIITNTIYNVVATDADYPGIVHAGKYGAFLGEFGYLATLSQTLSTVPGQMYLVSSWLNNPQALSNQQFTGSWDGQLFVNLTNPPATHNWTNLTRVITATGTASILQFGAQNDGNYFGFDDVSVRPVPPVSFQDLSVQANGLQLSWFSLPTLNYEVDYTTNLAAPAWTSVGSVTATTNVTSLTDTSAPTADSARFYRLVLLP